MSRFKAGQLVGVKCEVKPGAFSHERMVSFNSVDGPISGFVKLDDLRESEDGQWLVRGVVEAVNDLNVTVKVSGSFFKTNGVAVIPRELALAA